MTLRSVRLFINLFIAAELVTNLMTLLATYADEPNIRARALGGQVIHHNDRLL